MVCQFPLFVDLQPRTRESGVQFSLGSIKLFIVSQGVNEAGFAGAALGRGDGTSRCIAAAVETG